MTTTREIAIEVTFRRIADEPGNGIAGGIDITRAEITSPEIVGRMPGWSCRIPKDDGPHWYRASGRSEPTVIFITETYRIGARQIHAPHAQWARIPTPGSDVAAEVDLSELQKRDPQEYDRWEALCAQEREE